MKATVTFQKVAAGEFDVLLDGVKSQYSIVNGSKGVSGHGVNVYGIAKPAGTQWIGTLQAAKKLVAFWLTKEAK